VLPVSANLTLRNIGLLLFLAGVGTRAGYGFAGTMRTGGALLIGVGAVITVVVSAATMWAGYKLLKMPFDMVLGLVSGVQTQSACLAFANNQTTSDQPNVAYASVYAVAMIAKIVLAQLMVAWLL
jgi:putative transport protein